MLARDGFTPLPLFRAPVVLDLARRSVGLHQFVDMGDLVVPHEQLDPQRLARFGYGTVLPTRENRKLPIAVVRPRPRRADRTTTQLLPGSHVPRGGRIDQEI